MGKHSLKMGKKQIHRKEERDILAMKETQIAEIRTFCYKESYRYLKNQLWKYDKNGEADKEIRL